MNLTAEVIHPNFHYLGKKDIKGFPVCVFDRPVFLTPTKEQLAKYFRDRDIVQKLGGRMIKLSYECAGKYPCFSEQDCAEMIKAVQDTYPDFEIRDTWNGVGAYTFSVSIRKANSQGQNVWKNTKHVVLEALRFGLEVEIHRILLNEKVVVNRRQIAQLNGVISAHGVTALEALIAQQVG